MRLEKCAEAFVALRALADKDMPYETAYAISRVMRELKGEFDFFAKQEIELMNTYGERGEDGRVMFGAGQWTVAHGKEEEFLREREKLCSIEINYALPEQTAPPPEKISPRTIEALDGFINFKGGN